MGREKIDLIFGEGPTEIALARDDLPGTVSGVKEKELPEVWRDGYDMLSDKQRRVSQSGAGR